MQNGQSRGCASTSTKYCISSWAIENAKSQENRNQGQKYHQRPFLNMGINNAIVKQW